jgi:drug/metabolite transporter (DMT)-like permease
VNHGLLLTLAVGAVWTLVGVAMGTVARRGWSLVAFYLVGTWCVALPSWLLLPRWGALLAGQVRVPPGLLGVLVAAGVANTAGQVLLVTSMRRGNPAVAWTIGQSAMVVSYLWTVLVWHDPLSWNATLGMGLVVLALAALATRRAATASATHPAGNWPLLALGACLSVGTAQILLMLPSRLPALADTGGLRIAVINSTAAVAYLVAWGLRRPPIPRPVVAAALGWAVLALLSYGLMFAALDELGAHRLTGVFFPLGVGTCILGFALHARLIAREHLSPQQVLGLGAGLIGVLLLALPH